MTIRLDKMGSPSTDSRPESASSRNAVGPERDFSSFLDKALTGGLSTLRTTGVMPALTGEELRLIVRAVRLQMGRLMMASFAPDESRSGAGEMGGPLRPVGLLPMLAASKSQPRATVAPPDSLDRIVGDAAQRYQVAPELIRAVIRVESDFDPRAVSPKGAQGLMQLMPRTAQELGVSDPFDPRQNVMGGTRYLRSLLDRYQGDLPAALAAYNWGMGNLERSGGAFLPEETRNYIDRVMGHLNIGPPRGVMEARIR